MSDKKQTVIFGGGTLMPVFIVFLVLKLTGTVDWSWIWVTAPLWMPFAFVIGLVLAVLALPIGGAILAALFLAGVAVWEWADDKWRHRNWPAPRGKRF